jgi:pyroglutamyl-peptidase
LTGFGPFGSVISNPTERLVAHFATAGAVGHDLTTCILPTSFTRAPEILRGALDLGGRERQPFDTVLMLGVATGSAYWRVERFGRNWDEASVPDVDGFAPPARRIVPDAPDRLPVTVPIEALVAALEQAGLPAVLSDSAGGYLCNHALFVTLRHLACLGHPTRTGFLHVPADEQTFAPGKTTASMFPFTQQIAAVQAVLNQLTTTDPGSSGDDLDL